MDLLLGGYVCGWPRAADLLWSVDYRGVVGTCLWFAAAEVLAAGCGMPQWAFKLACLPGHCCSKSAAPLAEHFCTVSLLLFVAKGLRAFHGKAFEEGSVRSRETN